MSQPSAATVRFKPAFYSGFLLALFSSFLFSSFGTALFALLNYPAVVRLNRPAITAGLVCLGIIILTARFNFLALRASKGDADCAASVRRTVEKLPYWLGKAQALVWVLIMLAETLSNGFYPKTFMQQIFLPTLFGALMSGAAVFLLMERVIYSPSFLKLVEKLYTPQELLERRKTLYLPLSFKLHLMLGFLLVSLFTLLGLQVAMIFAPDELDRHYQAVALMVIGGTAITTAVFVGWVAGAIKSPVDGLVRKMEQLAEGDFNAKTRVYFNDEVSRLKVSFNTLSEQLREREQLRETFGKYVSIEVARKLMESGALDLGGEEMEATVLFCDIRNFTPLSEKLHPKDLVDFLNSYYSYIAPCVMSHGGVINKFMGDAILAIYAPALGAKKHACDALETALEMRAALAEYNKSGKAPVKVHFGIGIHTGRLVAGNVGLENRLEYTVIGDTVNLASRLDAKNKELGTDILISAAVHAAVAPSMAGRIEFQKIESIQVKGKSDAFDLYTVPPE